jgi:hypothetical protein
VASKKSGRGKCVFLFEDIITHFTILASNLQLKVFSRVTLQTKHLLELIQTRRNELSYLLFQKRGQFLQKLVRVAQQF